MRNYIGGIPNVPPQLIDRNAKARILAYFEAWTALHRLPGQHWGPLTKSYKLVLHELLNWFGRDTGLRFPSLDALAEAAKVSRSTAARAVHMLEVAGILTIIRRTRRAAGKLVRDSNAYLFRDLVAPLLPVPLRSKFQSGRNPQKSYNKRLGGEGVDAGLEAAIGRLMDARDERAHR